MNIKSISIIFLINVCCANSFFVDAVAGNDSNEGKSTNTAWKSIGKINKEIENKSFNPGDEILFKSGGEWLNSTLEINNLKGKSEARIVFEAYGEGAKPIIRVNNIPTTIQQVANAEGAAIIISKSKFLTVKNLEFRGGWAGLYLYDASFINLENITSGFDSNNGFVIAGFKKVPKNIIINNCNFDNKFSFPYSYNDSLIIDNQTDDGIVAYSIKKSEIKNCSFKNWGHASISLDGETGIKKIIVNNKIYNNVLTSPDIAYGGRMGVDDAKFTEVYDNIITNTSVETQLNGVKNNYHDNYFSGTRIPVSNDSDKAALLIQSYTKKNVKRNIYNKNIFVNAEGAGIKISGNNEKNVLKNIFSDNIISNCGLKTSYTAFEIEKLYDNEFGKTKKNKFINNIVFSKTNVPFNYRGENLKAESFNSKSELKPFKDEMKNNSVILIH
jgi:hypothetical protein